MTHQLNYFINLQKQFPSKRLLKDEVMRVLSISSDAAYRRMRGATALSTNELFTLQEHFGGEHTGANWFFNLSRGTVDAPGKFIDHLEDGMARIQSLGAEAELLIANPGIPFFHDVFAPQLTSFQLFIYGITCWEIPAWQNKPYHPNLIDHRVLDRARGIGEAAYQLPSRELWTSGMLDSVLTQIVFMHDSGRFATEGIAAAILDDLLRLVDRLETMAGHGRKFLPNTDPDLGTTFRPALNELASRNDLLLVKTPQITLLSAPFLAPNFLETMDESAVAAGLRWFERVERGASALGRSAGKHRMRFFNGLRRKIERTSKVIGQQERIEI